MPKSVPASKNARFPFKRDAYKVTRGGRSVFLDILCDTCGSYIALYQKDGPGPLKRMYLDRIHYPPALASLQGKATLRTMSLLMCPHCKEQLGIPMVWETEKRLAYKLFHAAVRSPKNTTIRQRA